MQQKPIKIIDLALSGAKTQLKKYQERMILIDKFGNDAMYSIEFYEPGNKIKNKAMMDGLKEEYECLLKLASELQSLRNKYFDDIYDNVIGSFFEDLKKK